MILVCLCRQGFEKEVAAEITDCAAYAGIPGYVKTTPDTGFVEFVLPDTDSAFALFDAIRFDDLVFVRHWFVTPAIASELPKEDRASPLMASAQGLPPLSKLEPITLDTNDGKALVALTRGVTNHIRTVFKKEGAFKAKSNWLGQLLFFSGGQACIGFFPENNGSLWAGGIPRLRAPKDAPSRATLKLEEAWHQFVPREQWDQRIAPSMRAVDLGAAPGGWTWQLVNKSMFVDAVDNGPMAENIMASGQVTHRMEDAFRFTPERAVHWLVSDIADKPARVAELITRWAENRWFKEAVFNLKLPMKKRYIELQLCSEIITLALDNAGIEYTLKFKQLYHDREEVTGHLVLF